MNSISSLRALAARDLPQMLDSRRCAAAEIAAIRSPRREDFQGNSQVADIGDIALQSVLAASVLYVHRSVGALKALSNAAARSA